MRTWSSGRSLSPASGARVSGRRGDLNGGKHSTADEGIEVADGFGTRANSATAANNEGSTAVNTRTKSGTTHARRAVVLSVFLVVLGVISTSASAADLPI